MDEREPIFTNPENVDYRYSEALEWSHEFRGLDPRDDGITLPIAQPVRVDLGKSPGSVEQFPSSRLPRVARDSSENLAAGTERSLDEQSNAFSRGDVHEIGVSDVYKDGSSFSTCFGCRFAPSAATLEIEVSGDFQEVFGVCPEWITTSPGRINLIGEHVDYLGGVVMPIAIDRHLVIEAIPVEGRICEVFPVDFGHGKPTAFCLDELRRDDLSGSGWLNYIVGVLSVYRDAGIEAPAFQATIRSDIPVGAGLSSSAALETAIALLIESLSGVEQDPVDRALLCQRAEHEFAGVPCGIMDQLAVGACRAGQAMRLDCSDLSIRHAPMPDGISILVADTGVKHSLGDGEYRKRRSDCDEALAVLGKASFREVTRANVESAKAPLGDRLFRRARHAVTEMARVEAFSSALAEGDTFAIGKTMKEGHESLRDDYEVSCPELDALVEAAYDAGERRGVLGARMTGGGFGGSTVTLVRTEFAENLRNHLREFYAEKFGRELECFITTAVDGASATRATDISKTS